ncbi:hypothetical protein Q1695_014046 [Nippostrongylus brasiliensis]|nr:hypothetical protein Q1695_014046 [Nippostrongylus brasiliensis]
MSCVKRHYNEPLPTQEVYCREAGSMCGYVEKCLSLSNWERRLAVITRDNNLVIYKEPLMGKIYELDKIKTMHMDRLPTGEIVSRIQTIDGKSVKLRLTGEDAPVWAAKLIHIRGEAAGHRSHPGKVFEQKSDSDQSIDMSSTESAAVVSTAASPFKQEYSNLSNSGAPFETTSYSSEVKESVPISQTSSFGDRMSTILISKNEPSRAQGGRAMEESNRSALASSAQNASQSSSEKNNMRHQLDELIKRYVKESKEESSQMITDLTLSARVDAAALRLSKINSTKAKR